MHHMIQALTIAAALGSGLIAGFFFSFSAVVMRALGRLPPDQGIAAMQRINVVVLNRWFFSAFFGTAAVCVVLIAWALLNLPAPGTAHILVASALYLAGVIVVTIAFNVPLNNRLARVDPGSFDGAHVWVQYLATWTRWNHVRTIAPLASAALFAIALH